MRTNHWQESSFEQVYDFFNIKNEFIDSTKPNLPSPFLEKRNEIIVNKVVKSCLAVASAIAVSTYTPYVLPFGTLSNIHNSFEKISALYPSSPITFQKNITSLDELYIIKDNDVQEFLKENPDLSPKLISIYATLNNIYKDTKFELSCFTDYDVNITKLFVTAMVESDDFDFLDTLEAQVFETILIPNADFFAGRVIFSQS